MGFQKRTEDFTCETCGAENRGTGYTNHCSVCLWSKHVDIEPGDRAATCGGLMRPLRIEGTQQRYRIVHQCERCGYEKVNDTALADDAQALVQLASLRGKNVV